MQTARVLQAPPPVIDPGAIAATLTLIDVVKNADAYKQRIEALKKATDEANEAYKHAKQAATEAAEAERAQINKMTAAHDTQVAKDREAIAAERAGITTLYNERGAALEKQEKALTAATNKLAEDQKKLLAYHQSLTDKETALNRRDEQLAKREVDVNARVAKLDALRGSL